MTFDDFIQDGLSKANKLFGKLAETGPNAVKTRERLFLDLKAELTHLSRFERNHLIPALGEQKKTRPLVKALEKDAEKVASLLAELETAPRAGDAFLQQLAELQGAFQAHVRDERKELLPAVLEALRRVQKAEQEAAEQAAAKAVADIEAAELRAAELLAADLKAAQARAQAEVKAAAETLAAIEAPVAREIEASEPPAPAPSTVDKASSDAATIGAIAPTDLEPETLEPPRLPIPAPLAAIAILHTLAAPLTPPVTVPIEPPKPAALPLPSPAYGVQAWANLMQEAAAGALMGYRMMLAYSNNTGFATLQTRLMKEQIELMTQSGYKLIEAAQRLTKTAGPG